MSMTSEDDAYNWPTMREYHCMIIINNNILNEDSGGSLLF